MSGLEGVPPWRTGSGSARGPPASRVRKTGEKAADERRAGSGNPKRGAPSSPHALRIGIVSSADNPYPQRRPLCTSRAAESRGASAPSSLDRHREQAGGSLEHNGDAVEHAGRGSVEYTLRQGRIAVRVPIERGGQVDSRPGRR